MKELKIEDLSKTYGTKTLLDAVNFSIRTGDRVGIIGHNGTGKSSFLRVITGKDTYDSGNITKPKDYTIAYLSQHPELDEEDTILEAVFKSDAPNIQLVKQYEQATLDLEHEPQNAHYLEGFNQLTETMNQNNAWDIEVQGRSILHQLGLHNLNRQVKQCSGGEKKRIGIAQALMHQPDLLILDEPTNHLDIESIQWLESYLANFNGALLLVTHDRYFLERVVNKIVELRHGKFYEYSGNYSQYLQQKEEELARIERMEEKQDRLFQQELAWMRKGAKARTTKQQARIQRFESLKEDINQRHQADNTIEFNFDQSRIGKQIIEMEDVNLSIGDQDILNSLTKNFVKGDRLGVIGKNGVGKSTLLNAMAGEYPIDGGSLTIGQTVRIGYYRQLDEDLPNDERILNYLTKIADEFNLSGERSISAVQLLERFNFPRTTHGMSIGQLSGGERRRLYFLTILIKDPNVLLLDEPTNDLDINTLQVLEDYLEHFEGTVVIVSHDRYFLDKTTNQTLELLADGQYLLDYGNYTEFRAKYPKRHAPSEKKVERVTDPSSYRDLSNQVKRMTYHEKQEWDQIESNIFDVEQKIDIINEEMPKHGNDAMKLMEMQEELEQLEDKLLHLYERYEYLSELKR